MNSPAVLSSDALERALSISDLTDPSSGPHALQLVVDRVVAALQSAWGCTVTVHRGPRLVPVADNYDALLYPADGAARDARYTRYASAHTVLRTQTSANLPALLRARAPVPRHRDELLVVPGLVYRRDTIDRLHVGEPHQLDVWRLASARPVGHAELRVMCERVLDALLPGTRRALRATSHPYTVDGLQLDVERDGEWVEIGECGLAAPAVLARAGLDASRVTGLAMGLGLDRLVMLIKGIDDIRLLRSADQRVASQLRDLAPYRKVSRLPLIRRDLSIVVAADRTAEELGDAVRGALGEKAQVVEALSVTASTPAVALPEPARRRLGLEGAPLERWKNVLLRVVLRPASERARALTDAEANSLRDRIYAAIHEGPVQEWAGHGTTRE